MGFAKQEVVRFAEDAAKELPKHDVGVLNEVIDIIFELAERYK